MAPAQKPSPPAKPEYRIYRSEDLFAKTKVVVILHDGRKYQLRVTSANKLILTA